MKKPNFRLTTAACYLGYVTQAISINLLPLFYVTFQNEFKVSLEKIGLLVTVLFLTQLIIDMLATRYGNRLSYRSCAVAAHVFAALGLVGVCFLPGLTADPYVGLLLSSICLSIGGGLTEVVISPIVDAMPGDKKAGAMSLLHSFYCWGFMAVVLLSTLFFVTLGTAQWRLLALLWAVVPAATAVLFAFVPMPDKPEGEDGGKGMSLKQLFTSRTMWLLMLLMVCSGAAEMAPAQWASLFAESGLQVSKTMGDLLGPCAFACLQGISRVVFAGFSSRQDPRRLMVFSGALCVVGYLIIVLSPWPLLSLVGFGICGIAVGPMWPGVLSLGSARFPVGGTAMFALLALCGDLGCSLAPAVVGWVSEGVQQSGSSLQEALKSGMGLCVLFPVLLFIGLVMLGRKKKTR